jgi:hypothetical protein
MVETTEQLALATEQLALAGDALQRAWRRDHANRRRHTRAPRRRTLGLILVAALALGSSVALASRLLKSPADEQLGMIEANTLFAGSNPTCVSVSASTFHCTLERTPTGETFYAQDGTQLFDVFLGTKMPTLDATRHVDGGCVSRSADGRSWDCYLGQTAVANGVIGAGLLGDYAPTPAAG